MEQLIEKLSFENKNYKESLLKNDTKLEVHLEKINTYREIALMQ